MIFDLAMNFLDTMLKSMCNKKLGKLDYVKIENLSICRDTQSAEWATCRIEENVCKQPT